MIILDTNVISALMRPDLNEVVLAWLNRQPEHQLFTSSVSVMEIRIGLLLMANGKRRTMLETGFEKLIETILSGRILPLELEGAEAASMVAAAEKRRGMNIDIGDHQIAGIALANRATLATRNTKHFEELDIEIVNPWTD